MDITSIIGLVLGISAIVLGNMFEGGKLEWIIQPTAAFIVFGGTFGAAMLQFPLVKMLKAFHGTITVFFDKKEDAGSLIQTIVIFYKNGTTRGDS